MGKNANGEGSITYDKKRRRHRVRVPMETPQGTVRKYVGWFKTRDESHGAKIEALSAGWRPVERYEKWGGAHHPAAALRRG